jgi:hypothetical protein
MEKLAQNSTSMKALILNILFTLAWAVIGHYFGIFSLFFSFIVFPLMFVLSAYLGKHNLSSLIVIPFCFSVILINDYLFRIYGGGIHDDAGRGLCELIFYATFSTSTIALLFVAFKLAKQNKLVIKLQWFYNSLLVICSALVTYFVFIKFSVKI